MVELTMGNRNNIVAIIPARGGSKGIPRKNIRELAVKPLIAYTIEAAKKSKYIAKIICSTDDEEIALVAKTFGAEVPFLRPKELAKDDTPMLPVIQHAVRFLEEKGLNIDLVILLQPTSPLRSEKEIDAAIEKLIETNADSVVTVHKVDSHSRRFRLERDRLLPLQEKYFQSHQEAPDLYALNGAIYIFRRDTLMKDNTFYGEDIRAIVMKEEKSIDIDTPFDFFIAEMIFLHWKGEFVGEKN